MSNKGEARDGPGGQHQHIKALELKDLTLFSFSAVIFLMPYLGMMLSFVRLRHIDAERPQPFRIAGGTWVAIWLAMTCFTVLTMAISLLFYVPDNGFNWPVIIGTTVILGVGEFLIRLNKKG